MPTPTLAELQDALADQIRSVLDDVTDISVQVEPRWVTNPTPPTIDIYPGDPSHDPTWRSMGDAIGADMLTVRARVDLNDHTAGQDLLLALMDEADPLSVVAAIEDDDTLGGVAQTLDIKARSGFIRFVESSDHIGCVWSVLVKRAYS